MLGNVAAAVQTEAGKSSVWMSNVSSNGSSGPDPSNRPRCSRSAYSQALTTLKNNGLSGSIIASNAAALSCLSPLAIQTRICVSRRSAKFPLKPFFRVAAFGLQSIKAQIGSFERVAVHAIG